MSTEGRPEQVNKTLDPESIANKKRMFEIIALTSGNNNDFSVAWNPKGAGSNWNPNKKIYTLDEEILEDDLEVGLGVAEHEANHQIVSSLDYVRDLWPQLGFSLGLNAAEDPRANQGGMKIMPGTRPWIKAYIEKDLGPDGQLNYQDMEEEARKKNGYVPKFLKGGSELIRYWHEKEFKNSINNQCDVDRFLKEIPDEEVRGFIDSARTDFEKYYQTTPTTRDPEEKNRRAKESSDIFRKNIWPKYQKLIDQSMKDQSMVDMIKQMLQGNPQPGQGGQAIEIPFDALPKDVQDEIKQKMKENAEKQKSKQGQKDQQGQGEGQSGDNKPDQQSGQQSKDQSQGGSQSGSNSGKTEGKNQDGESNAGADGKQNIPWDDLSKKAKKEIEKAYDKLPADQKKKHEDQAKKDLENAEDKANEKLNGQIKGTDHGQSHKEIKEQIEKDQKEKEEKERELDQKDKERKAEQIVKSMESSRKKATENLTTNVYQEILNQPDVAVAMVQLDREYTRIFQPHESPDVRHSYTGLRVSMPRAMQMEADPKKGNIFEVKGRPTEKKYRFLWLIDQSGSMKGEKINEAMKAVVINAQLADKHNLETAIYGFTTNYEDNIHEYKGFDVKKMRNEDRAKIARLQNEGGGYTPTLEATEEAYKILKSRTALHPMQNNYFITLTDGQPDDGTEPITREIRKIRKDPTMITCGFGIGPDTEFVNRTYPQLPDIIKRKIAIKLGKTPDQISNSFESAIDFVKASVIIMPYWIEHPEMFHK